jgi:hypothetical protein
MRGLDPHLLSRDTANGVMRGLDPRIALPVKRRIKI